MYHSKPLERRVVPVLQVAVSVLALPCKGHGILEGCLALALKTGEPVVYHSICGITRRDKSLPCRDQFQELVDVHVVREEALMRLRVQAVDCRQRCMRVLNVLHVCAGVLPLCASADSVAVCDHLEQVVRRHCEEGWPNVLHDTAHELLCLRPCVDCVHDVLGYRGDDDRVGDDDVVEVLVHEPDLLRNHQHVHVTYDHPLHVLIIVVALGELLEDLVLWLADPPDTLRHLVQLW